MKHAEVNDGMLRSYLDSESGVETTQGLGAHVETCPDCMAQLRIMSDRAAGVRAGMDQLPLPVHFDEAAAWGSLRKRLDASPARPPIRWSPWQAWSLAGAGAVALAAILIITVAPIRGWAEELLAIFRIEHFTILEVNSDAMRGTLENDNVFNQQIGHMLSDQVTVTQPPQNAQRVADAATAARLAGFDLHLIAGENPSALLFRSAMTAQMKLDRDRLQSILNEAGRTDLQIPGSLDGAVIGMHVPAGVVALYGNCRETAARWLGEQPPSGGAGGPTDDAGCITLNELPSPTVSAPEEVDPAQIAQVALQFLGMNPVDAANFTQTVDWKTTLLLPVFRGISRYEKVEINGNEGVLLRPSGAQPSGRFNLLWVDNGIVYCLIASGDDVAAVNLASKVE
jgi:hypothetical protein